MLATILVASSPALASKYTESQYYSIEGTTAEELIQQMSHKGPFGYSGYAKWDIKIKYTWNDIGHLCVLTSSGVDLNILYTLPKWSNKSRGEVELQRSWDIYYTNLMKHENGHGEHGELAYKEIKKGFSRISSRENCRQLEQALRTVTDNAIAKYAQKDVDYDQHTGHGDTQGASWSMLTGNIETEEEGSTLLFLAIISLAFFFFIKLRR